MQNASTPKRAPETNDRRRFLKLAAIGTAGAAVAAQVAKSRPADLKRRARTLAQQLGTSADQVESNLIRMQQEVQRALQKPVEERDWVMVIDPRKCIACNSCTISCKAENVTPPGMTYRRVPEIEFGAFPNVGRTFMPSNCMQCDNPPCAVAPGVPPGAIFKRPDGIVEVDYTKLRGQAAQTAAAACPYNALYVEDGSFYTDETPDGTQPYETRDFQEYDQEYNRSNDGLKHQIARMFSVFVEPVAQTRDSMTGEYFSGLPVFEPVKDSLRRIITDDEFDFQLITYKEITGGQSRTVGDYWMVSDVLPENFVLMNPTDASRLGLGGGDEVKLVSRSNPDGVWNLQNGRQIPMVGKVKVIIGIRPGVIAVSWHYGHWAYGASNVVIAGVTVDGDARRATELCPNAAMRVDDNLKNVCLTDPIGGSASFYDTRVNLARV